MTHEETYIHTEFTKGTADKFIADHLGWSIRAVKARRERYGWVRPELAGRQFTEAEDAVIVANFAAHVHDRVTAQKLSRTIDAVKNRRRILKLSRAKGPKSSEYLPTEEDIARECERIRATWSQQDEIARAKWMHASEYEHPAYRMMGRANGQFVFAVEDA